MKSVTDITIEGVIAQSSDKVQVVDCTADWCAPCKKLKPILEKLNSDMSDMVEIHTLDIEENPQTVQRYQVRGVPTLLWFRNGEHIASTVGMQSVSALVGNIERLAKLQPG